MKLRFFSLRNFEKYFVALSVIVISLRYTKKPLSTTEKKKDKPIYRYKPNYNLDAFAKTAPIHGIILNITVR